MLNDGAGDCAAEPGLELLIGAAIAAAAGRHPGIIAESVVARILSAYDLVPREVHHRERRRNHEERIRRFSHEVYRILADAAELDPAREIAARVGKAFLMTRKPEAGRDTPAGWSPP